MEGIDTKLGRLVIPIVAIAAVVVIGAVAPSLVTNAVLASEPASEGTPTPTATPTPEPTPEPAPTRTPTMPTAPADATDAKAQPDGLFSEVDGDPPPSIGVDTLDSRLVGIDFGQLARVTKPPDGPKTRTVGETATPQTLVLNLFDGVVFTGIVEHVEPTSSGHVLWGRLDGVELGTMTLVVNGSVVTGTVRTPDAVYTIRTAGDGAYIIRQIDESSLPPLGEPLKAPLPTPHASQGVSPTPTSTPNGTSTPTPTPTPTVPTAPADATDAKAQPGGLFSEVEGDPPPSSGVDTLASRLVDIDFGQIARVTKPPDGPKIRTVGETATPQTLVLNLFDDVVFTGIVEHVEPTSSGHVLWGRLDGVELGTMTLVVNGSVVAGTVRTPDAVYTIRTAAGGAYVVRQIDESSLPPLGEPLKAPLPATNARARAADSQPDDGSEIDVMVVYTPAAKYREGGRAAIEALIDLFVAETNQAYANSGVVHRIRLVLREEVQYTEDGDSHIDLRRLRQDSDGYMDHVHELRDLYAADLVHIVTGRSDNVCGLGGGEFALTVFYCGGLVFAHELGHNMSLHHDRYVLRLPKRGANYGYVNQRMFEPGAPESARWRTIMAYGRQCSEVGEYHCQRVPYFSNPEVTYNGDPMGVPADNPSTGVDGPADAVGTLNDTRETTANYRRSSTSPTPRVGLTLSPYWLSENGGVSTVTATLHRRSGADTTVTVSASPADAVRLSANVVLTIPAGQTVSRGAVTITGVDNGDQTGDVTVTISATAANASSQGVIAPEPVALAIADDETTPVVTLSLSPSEIVEFDGRTFVTAMLNNRSIADTMVTVSATPAEVVEEIAENTLTIPAGQSTSVGLGVGIYALDDEDLTEARKSVTVSGTATNSQGVTGPESVTLTIIDDDAPIFADDSIAYTFTAGVAGSRFLPEAAYGNGTLTYSLSPATSNGVTFTTGPPARIGVSKTSAAASETSYTLTATDADGDTDTMTVSITVRNPVCADSAAVSGYTAAGIVADCEALLASRDTLRADQSLNWSEDLSIRDWQGIEVADNRVVRIDMSFLELTGTIPSELGSLANLQELALLGNQLTGAIPPELGSLANLRGLHLWRNQLTGPIPPELGDLSNLNVLALSNNQLSGEIPADLGSLANLVSLSLWGNQLTGPIPSELGSLTNLQRLFLKGNLFTGCIPAGLRALEELEEHDLDRLGLPDCVEVNRAALVAFYNSTDGANWTDNTNWLSDAPIGEWHGVTTNDGGRITRLDLRENRLTGVIPPELGRLSNLEGLYLSGNQLTGEIPASLGGLTNLQRLFLSGNLFTGCIPGDLRNVADGDPNNDPDNDLGDLGLPDCAALERAALVALYNATDGANWTDNSRWLSDEPLDTWYGVTIVGGRMARLHLGGNGLSGDIPSELGNLTHLRELWLGDGNHLTGQIPPELSRLTRLKVLDLGGSELSGTIPTWLRDMSDIRRLYLDNNQFTGEIPSELGNLPNLELLYLFGNQLTGEIPAELGSLSNLQSLSLWDNQLTGEIPTELGNLTNLQSLSLWDNQLTGEIPTELGILSNLQTLSLNENQFTGEIPTELGILSNLRTLWLSGNQLTGEIPAELGSLSNLQYLILAANQLTGEIPTELGNLTNLQSLSLWDNQLTGEIPTELGNLTNLQYLTLAANQLTGEIPTELGNLSDLQSLNLGTNQLTGEIPTELGNLSNLVVLSLWGNQLTGQIPSELGILSNLQSLWLSGNQLTGCIPPGLREVANNDLASLSLPFCDAPLDDCVTGGAGADATNTGLVEDCEALLDARDTLAGSGSLNWSEDTPITDWDGVTVEGTPRRVTRLDLRNKGLTGSIPPEIGNLANLQWLFLSGNQLSGPIPIEMGSLANLQWLFLSGNQLSGPIPTEMGSLSNLEVLSLINNQLTGALPQSFTGLTALQRFTFYSNLGICAPVDNAFQTWLQSIDIVRGSSCAPVDSPEDRAVLVELHSATDGASWGEQLQLAERPANQGVARCH